MRIHRLVRLVAGALLAVAVVVPSGAQSGPFTLEQVMSAPFPSSLTSSASDGRVAWVFNARGARNIWVAEPPDYKGRQLTSSADDDGQAVGDLAWTPDARAIVFVRGGGPNRQGEIPNPLSQPDAIEQAVWVVALDGSAPRRLGLGQSPAVSPKGDRVAFLHRGQAWWAPLDESEKATQLLTARGQVGSLRWSPDGSMLAIVSSRGDHSFVGVFDLASRALRYLDPSVDRDGNPVWSPDGGRVAFTRIPASRGLFSFSPQREAEPWSIRVADVKSGRGSEVWKAARGAGSAFHGVSAANQLLWGAGDRLVFPWERDGWVHLYSVPARGGQAELLTPGAFEVEYASLSPDGTAIVFNSNQDDIDRRHIWKVPVAGGRPTALTSGTGIEWAPALTSDGQALAFFRSDARMPARPAIQIGTGPARELAPGSIAPGFPAASLVEPQQVVFAGADGMKIHGQLFLPAALRARERYPAVLFFHGGSRRQMLLGWHYMDYYHNTYAMNQYLASRGYIVLSVNYRSGTGYGMEFREALNYGAAGASEFNDVLGAGLYLRGRPDVDPARIGLWGGSYGGYLTAMGLARASDLFAAGVDLHGVHDWNVVIRNFTPSYDPQVRQQQARLAFESSPMAHMRTWRSPVLLVHGDDDRNVPFSETVDLVEELRKQGVEFEQIVFPDEIHGFLVHARWREVFERAAAFFDRHLWASSRRGN